MNQLSSIAVYLRKSRSDPADESIEETLARHKKTLLDFAKWNRLIITKIYEEVVSGDGLFVRPQMIQLLSDVEKDMYQGVLCVDIDRLGRVDTKDRGIILDTLKTHNTRIITPQKIYDLNDDIDEFSTEIQMLLARQELKKITQRLQNGMRRSCEDGYHLSEPPYGYRRTYIDRRPSLAIYEPEAEIIRMIFDMYVNQGMGSASIAKYLNSLGYKPRKNDHFSRTTVSFYLQNPIYIGKIVWNKRHRKKKKHPDDKNTMILNDQKEWIVADGKHEAIIDEALFYEAQKIRTKNIHPPYFTGEIVNPFAGLIRCANCKEIMVRQTSKKTGPRLICNTPNCNKSIVISKVEERVLEMLHNALKEAQASNIPKPKIDSKSTFLQDQLTQIKKEFTKLQGQNDRLHDLLEQGIYSIDTFLERENILKNKKADLEKMEKQVLKELSKLEVKAKLENDFIPTLEELLSNYDQLSPAEKNKMLKKIVSVIYYKREKSSSTQTPFELDIEFNEWI